MLPRAAIPRRIAALGGLILLSTVLDALAPPAAGAPRRVAGETPVERLGEAWRWARFTVADGLPSDTVRWLVERAPGAAPGAAGDEAADEADVVWVGTDRGVAWFDGWVWHAVGPAQGLPRERVVAMARAGDGTLVVATQGALFRGSRAGFAPVVLPAPWKGHVESLGTLADGSVLAACARGAAGELGLLRLVGERVRELPLPAAPETGQVPMVRVTADGQAWLNLADGLYRRERGGWARVVPAEFAPLVPTAVLADETPDELGRRGAWIAIGGPPPDIGLLRLEPDGTLRHEAETPGIVQAATRLADGTALVLLDSGAVRWNGGDGWRDLATVPEPLERARFLHRRPDGDLWVGTDRGLHLFRASLERWREVPVRRAAPAFARRVHELALDGAGRLWMATAGGVEAVGADGAPLALPPIPDAEGAQLTGLAVDDAGAVWVSGGGSMAGVRRWDGVRWSAHLADADGGPIGFVHKIRRDDAGRLWLAELSRDATEPSARAGGVLVVERDGTIRRWPHEERLPGRRVYDVADGPDGALWFGTSKGVARFAGGGERAWGPADGLEAWPVSRVRPTPDGGAWLAYTCGRLARVEADGGARYVAHGPDPASAPAIFDLALDARDDLWITSSSGLHLLRDDCWIDFGDLTGLAPARLWPVLVTPDERLVVGSLGRGTFTLDLAGLEAVPPYVRLSEPAVDGRRVRLSWYPHAWMGELARDEVPTRFRLDAGPWSAWSTRTETDLDALAPGEHVVRVQALGPLGVVGAAAVDLRVPPPLFRRAAFAIPIALLLAALGVTTALSLLHRRRDADALRRSELEHRRLLEEASDGIVLFDAAGRCASANSRAADLFGIGREALRGRTPCELFGARWVDPPADGTPRLVEQRLVDASGATIVVEAGAKRLEDGGLQVIARDITERTRTEQERLAIERRLAETQKLEGLALLAGGVAHDFNNLLTVILGSAEEARHEIAASSPAREELQRIVAAAESAAELTQQLLAYAGRGSIRRESVDVGALVRETTHLLRSSLGRRVRLDLELAPDLPTVDADVGRLRQVLINLVVNASEAMDDGGGAIRVRTALAPADPAAGARRGVLVEVRDDGKGMTREEQARIFDPFYTTKAGGRGLGLAAVRGILRSHDGRIDFESAPGRGTTFRLWLPAGRLAPALEQAPALRPSRRHGLLLVVDDDPHVRRVTANVLRGAGYDVVAVGDARAARTAYAEDPDRYDALVLDQLMPYGTGTQILEDLRRERPDLPGLIVSGYSDDDVSAWCEARPRTDYLQKPYPGQGLLARLDLLLREPALALPEPQR